MFNNHVSFIYFNLHFSFTCSHINPCIFVIAIDIKVSYKDDILFIKREATLKIQAASSS